jgi:hypothetical protein
MLDQQGVPSRLGEQMPPHFFLLSLARKAYPGKIS